MGPDSLWSCFNTLSGTRSEALTKHQLSEFDCAHTQTVALLSSLMMARPKWEETGQTAGPGVGESLIFGVPIFSQHLASVSGCF